MNVQAGNTLWDKGAEIAEGSDRANQVRDVFRDTSRYLKQRALDVQVRVDTVADFARQRTWVRLLDIGCGDGSISLPLLTAASHLTLLDLSSSMIALAAAKVPTDLRANVEMTTEDFMADTFTIEPLDLIVSVGVIAHVASPDAFLAKISALLRPGGSLILEFTDAWHPVGLLGRMWGSLKELLAPPRYVTNKLAESYLQQLFEKHSFNVSRTFRYSRVPLPGFDRFVSLAQQYRICRFFFGTTFSNAHASWGNEHICLLTKR